MWLFTKYGFFSVVCARVDAMRGSPVDPDTLMVRARAGKHLESLRGRFPDLLGIYKIARTDATDYAFRMFLPKEVWERVMVDLTKEIDFDNFKDEVSKHQGQEGFGYKTALTAVWSTMLDFQEVGLYGARQAPLARRGSFYGRRAHEDLLLASGDGTVYERFGEEHLASSDEVHKGGGEARTGRNVRKRKK